MRSLFRKSPRNSLSPPPLPSIRGEEARTHTGGSERLEIRRDTERSRHALLGFVYARGSIYARRGESVCIHRFCGNVYKQCFVLDEFNVVSRRSWERILFSPSRNSTYFPFILSQSSSSSSSSLFNILSKNLFHRISSSTSSSQFEGSYIDIGGSVKKIG